MNPELRDFENLGVLCKRQVTAKMAIGGMRVVDVPAGELLPRIC